MSVPPKGAAPVSTQPQQAGCLSTIVRLVWIMAGNFALVVILGLILQRGSFSFLDAVYWLVVIALLFIRYADIRWLRGLDSEGRPATMKDWAKYARLLVPIAGGAWVVLHALLLLLRR